jgi:hypothetical protein
LPKCTNIIPDTLNHGAEAELTSSGFYRSSEIVPWYMMIYP